MLKIVILAALVAVSSAGYIGAPAAFGYAAPAVHAAPLAVHAAPAVAAYHGGPVVNAAVPAGGLLGVAYSAAPAVAHMTYSNALGISYAY